MLLVVGLGNPGSDYARNRHNVGFMAVDGIVHRYRFSSFRSKFQGQLAEGEVAGRKIYVFKPMTFMNRSGDAVLGAMRFYKIRPEDVLVFHDELDLAHGKLRVKRGGGHAGHNGLRSIQARIGADYRRVRIGIGHPGGSHLVHNFVLSPFDLLERVHMEKLVAALADDVGLLISGEPEKYMTRMALLAPPPAKEE